MIERSSAVAALATVRCSAVRQYDLQRPWVWNCWKYLVCMASVTIFTRWIEHIEPIKSIHHHHRHFVSILYLKCSLACSFDHFQIPCHWLRFNGPVFIACFAKMRIACGMKLTNCARTPSNEFRKRTPPFAPTSHKCSFRETVILLQSHGHYSILKCLPSLAKARDTVRFTNSERIHFSTCSKLARNALGRSGPRHFFNRCNNIIN